MLRDDKEIALNKVLITCRKVAVHCRQSAGLLEDQPMMDMFRHMANCRTNDTSRVEALMRGLGYLPGEPDSDRLDFSRLITLTRSTISSDRKRTLLDKSIELEIELEAAVGDTLGHNEWPENVLELLQELTTTCRRNRDEMMNKL